MTQETRNSRLGTVRVYCRRFGDSDLRAYLHDSPEAAQYPSRTANIRSSI